MASHSGGCYCGAIRYTLAKIGPASVCYCDNCRKASGAQSLAWVGCEKAEYSVIQGTPKSFTAPNGAIWTFCDTCGTSLTWTPSASEGFLTVTIGSLDDPAAVPPQSVSYPEDRLPWDVPYPATEI